MEKISTTITEYSQTAAGLAELAARYKDVVFEVTTKSGMEQAKKARAELRTLRTTLEATRVRIKAPALKRCQDIDSEAKRITGELSSLEDPIDAQIKAEEQRKEAERQAAARAEQERLAGIQRRIGAMQSTPLDCIGRPVAEIEASLQKLRAEDPAAWAQELLASAEVAKREAITKVEKIHASAVSAAQVEAQRAELERQRKAQEEQQSKAQRERDEADRLARLKIEAEEREARKRIEDDERRARAERDEADRKARQERDAEEQRLKVERDRIEAERRSIEDEQRRKREEEEARAAAARRADEDRQRQEREQAAATERERLRKENERLDARQMLITFKERFGHLQEFETVVAEIDALLGITA